MSFRSTCTWQFLYPNHYLYNNSEGCTNIFETLRSLPEVYLWFYLRLLFSFKIRHTITHLCHVATLRQAHVSQYFMTIGNKLNYVSAVRTQIIILPYLSNLNMFEHAEKMNKNYLLSR